MEKITAILVDGGFYRKRAHKLFGDKTAEERASEIVRYCNLHIQDSRDIEHRFLYRIFYYDCPPLDITLYHPLEKKNIDLRKTPTYAWSNAFFSELRKKRKIALRLGRLAGMGHGYRINPDTVKKLCNGSLDLQKLQSTDFSIDIEQKGVDMRIGLDIANLAYKRLVNQIILISGDSDFVPAAKMARREGIDFILDPMNSIIADDLSEHVDGVFSHWHDTRITKGLAVGLGTNSSKASFTTTGAPTEFKP